VKAENAHAHRRELLVETDELAAGLGDPALRLFDCTVILEVGPSGLSIRSGRDDWADAHIPGAGFLDLLEELSAPSSRFRFMLPPEDQFVQVMSAHGVGEGTRVVLYDSRDSSWAARMWWMLRAYGFDAARVLNGGWTKWTLEGRPVSSEPPAHDRRGFTSRPRAGVFVDKDAVLSATRDGGATCLLNGLSAAQHRGTGPTVPGGRPGHIPGSRSMPAADLVDPSTQAFLPEAELRARLSDVGALGADRVITYCGGGIAAAEVAFALRLVGRENVAIYDASLEEWATDETLPIDVG
jgi:thiosulfate/3-mercaptopyruvate sulfurtransferase